jgi:hypothetical protein
VPSGATRVGVDGEWIGFGIIERILHKRPPPPKGGDPSQAKVGSFFIRPRPELVPSGELTLVARPLDDAVWITRTWHDTKTRKIEQCLNEFVVQLYALAEEVKAGRIARERQARAQADEARRRWEDQERERDLRERLERWRLARDVRAYVREAHALAENAEVVIVKGGDLDEHLSWAAGFADHIDPWRGLRDDIARIAAERGNPEKS